MDGLAQSLMLVDEALASLNEAVVKLNRGKSGCLNEECFAQYYVNGRFPFDVLAHSFTLVPAFFLLGYLMRQGYQGFIHYLEILLTPKHSFLNQWPRWRKRIPEQDLRRCIQDAECINTSLPNGWTMLHVATRWNYSVALAEILARPETDLNVMHHPTGITPLDNALMYSSHACLNLLLLDHRLLLAGAEKRESFVDAYNSAPNRKRQQLLRASFRKLPTYIRQPPWGDLLPLRAVLGLSEYTPACFFVLLVLVSDGYLQPKCSKKRWRKRKQFFRITARFPMDIQMVVCNRMCRLPSDIILPRVFETVLKCYLTDGWLGKINKNT